MAKPFCAQLAGQAVPRPNQTLAQSTRADTNQEPFGGRPRSAYGAHIHIRAHLVVDARGRPPKRDLAQRIQVPLAKELVHGPACLLGHAHLAFPEALEQFIRGEIDEIDFAGAVEHPVRQRLANDDPRDLSHDVVETLQMLHVERRIDVDACGDEFFHILIALGVPRARRIRMGEFVDDHRLRMPREDRVHVHLG